MEHNPHFSSAQSAELAERYAIEGEAALCDPRVAAWYAEHPALAREIDAGLAVLRASLAEDEGVVKIPSSQRKERPVVAPRSLSSRLTPTRPGTGPSMWATWRNVVTMASVTAAAVAGIIFTRTRNRIAGEQAEIHSTGSGQQRTVVLADGSRVTLAPQSTIQVRGTTVDLVGEAYFETVHSAQHPFVVRTGNVATRVLGTAFDVRRYAEDQETRVAVSSGKVATGVRRTAVVPAGAVAFVTDSVVTVRPDAAEQYAMWMHGQLVFRDTPVEEMLATVGRWAGVRFRIADSAWARRRITTALDIGERDQLLHILGLTLDANFVVSRDTSDLFTVQPKAAHESSAPTRRVRTNTLYSIPKEAGR